MYYVEIEDIKSYVQELAIQNMITALANDLRTPTEENCYCNDEERAYIQGAIKAHFMMKANEMYEAAKKAGNEKTLSR